MIVTFGSLTACGGVEEFERELTGPTAVAWQTCKKAAGDVEIDYPRLVENDDDRIYFGWSRSEVDERGSLLSCVTDETGKNLLEIDRVGAEQK